MLFDLHRLPLTAASAKLDASGPLLDNFALLKTQKLQNVQSEYLEFGIGLREVLETPKYSVGFVRSVRDFLMTQVSKHF